MDKFKEAMNKVQEKLESTCQSKIEITTDQINFPTAKDFAMALTIVSVGGGSVGAPIDTIVAVKSKMTGQSLIESSFELILTGAITIANADLEVSLGRTFTLAEMELMSNYIQSKIKPSEDDLKMFVSRHTKLVNGVDI